MLSDIEWQKARFACLFSVSVVGRVLSSNLVSVRVFETRFSGYSLSMRFSEFFCSSLKCCFRGVSSEEELICFQCSLNGKPSHYRAECSGNERSPDILINSAERNSFQFVILLQA